MVQQLQTLVETHLVKLDRDDHRRANIVLRRNIGLVVEYPIVLDPL